MAKKMIRPLHSEADYDAALKQIERYFESEPKPGTPEADRFDLLALIVEDYERKRWPMTWEKAFRKPHSCSSTSCRLCARRLRSAEEILRRPWRVSEPPHRMS